MGVVGELEFMSRCEYMRIIKKCEIQIKSLKFYWKIENRKMGDLSFHANFNIKTPDLQDLCKWRIWIHVLLEPVFSPINLLGF